MNGQKTSPGDGKPFAELDERELFVVRGGTRMVVLYAGVSLLIALFFLLTYAVGWLLSPFPSLALGAIAVLGLVLASRGHVQVAATVLVAGAALLAFATALTFSGLRTQAFFLLPVAGMMAHLVLHRRAAVGFAAVVTACLVVLTVLAVRDLLPSVAQTSQVPFGIVVTASFLVSTVLGYFAEDSFRRAYGKSIHLRRQLEQQVVALRCSEGNLQTLFREDSLPSVIGDKHGKIIDANDAWLNKFGFDRAQVIGKAGNELGYWAQNSERDLVVAQLSDSGRVDAMPVNLVAAGGHIRQFLLSVTKIETSDGVRLVVRLVDQTERLHAEAAQRTLNIELEARVLARTNELSQALDRLKGTQEELIQAETLASLGAMVAGISHELNTPIGNAITVTTSLQHRVAGLAQTIQGGALRRSELQSFVDDAKSMTDLVERSVHRASELVSSFKQVAIDQTSERRREFMLPAVVEDILATLHHTVVKTPVEIDNQITDAILCDSYPGPLGQVLSNLINNALIHAFGGRERGRIMLTAKCEDAHVLISVADDGVGMSAQTQVHVFDPFFTTRLGKGGSGLGLAICRRLVVSVLGGELKVRSEVGAGTTFTIRIPAIAPGRI